MKNPAENREIFSLKNVYPNVINSLQFIDPETESHYAYHTLIDTGQYPQIHDFYEITLVTAGTLCFSFENQAMDMPAGSLIFVRPGDIHSKAFPEPSEHINLAFAKKSVISLFEYLYDKKTYSLMLSRSHCPPILLSSSEFQMLRQKMTGLSLIPPDRKSETRRRLRLLLAEVINSHFIEFFRQEETSDNVRPPVWLREALEEMQKLDNLSAGLNFLREYSGKTKEHICRSFRKYYNITPSDYINTQRLNYVANMLLHSNREIMDLAYEVGFQNISYFYQLFKQTFQDPPRRFREKNRENVISRT
jgi:AraC family cel operon transcriptional repressor